jgi:hypothetical protein
VSHRFDRVRRQAGGAGHAAVVECHDPPFGGQVVDQSGVPVVEVAAEVLEEDERHITLA